MGLKKFFGWKKAIFLPFFYTWPSLGKCQTVVSNGLPAYTACTGLLWVSERAVYFPPSLAFHFPFSSCHFTTIVHCSTWTIPSLLYIASFLQRRLMSVKTHPLPVLCPLYHWFSFLKDKSLLFKTCINLPNSLAGTSTLSQLFPLLFLIMSWIFPPPSICSQPF